MNSIQTFFNAFTNRILKPSPTTDLRDLPADIFLQFFTGEMEEARCSMHEFTALSLVSKEFHVFMSPLYSNINLVVNKIFATENAYILFYNAPAGLAVYGMNEADVAKSWSAQGKVCDLRTGIEQELSKQQFETRYFQISSEGRIFGMTKRGEFGFAEWDKNGKSLRKDQAKTTSDFINTTILTEKGLISGGESGIYLHRNGTQLAEELFDIRNFTNLVYDSVRDLFIAYSHYSLAIKVASLSDLFPITLTCMVSSSVHAQGYSKKLGLLAYVNEKNAFTVWDSVKKEDVFSHALADEISRFTYFHEASSHIFLVTEFANEFFMNIWKTDQEKVQFVNRFSLRCPDGLFTLVSSMFFLPSHSLCVTAYYESLHFWNIHSGSCEKTIKILEETHLKDLQYHYGKFYVVASEISSGKYSLYCID